MQRGIRAVGPIPVTQAWERYAVPALWPTWAPHIRGVELRGVAAGATPTARIAPGMRGRVRGPLGLRVSFVVRDVDERRRTWSWDVRVGPLRMHLHHALAVDPAGTATWLTVRGPAAAVTAYLPVARLALHRLVHDRPCGPSGVHPPTGR